jgi:hypothetical protein
MAEQADRRSSGWPRLRVADWADTRDTLHMWMQIVGKIRLATTPLINHWWNTTLFLTASGITTTPMPYGDGAFEIIFDFVDHRLLLDTSWGMQRTLELRPETCADFYEDLMALLADAGVDVKIWPVSVELPEQIKLDRDRAHSSYDAAYVNRWWHVMLSASIVMQAFRGLFIGKSSPVHFFWGSFDLAVTRFSGRRAPPRAGADAMTREAYSHEVYSCGFWPGGGAVDDAAFYAYAAPPPEGFDTALPGYNRELGEYVLMYDEVRKSASPRDTLMAFFQSTYEAAATLGAWNRAELERNESHGV